MVFADCHTIVHWQSIDTGTEIPQQACWQSVHTFNADTAERTCPACGTEHPRVELGDIAWPTVADAIRSAGAG